MAEAQAKAYEAQAESAQKSGAFSAMQTRHQQALDQAHARAQVGASGVAFQGSPTEVLTANAGQQELDAQAILYGSQLQQSQLYSQADISRFSGQQAQAAGYIGAASGFISGISSLYDPYKSTSLGGNPFGN